MSTTPTREKDQAPSPDVQVPALAILRAICEGTRLHILVVLREHDGRIYANELLGLLIERGAIMEQPTLAHHLRILLAAGVVTRARKGKYTYYAICAPAITAALATIEALLPESEATV